MNIDNISKWVSQPNICRCCLSASGTWDLTAAYINDAGLEEVFIDVLQTSFGITLSYINEMNSSRLVCEMCMSHLRDASTFRDQVVRADKCFSQYWSNTKAKDQKVDVILDGKYSEAYRLGDPVTDDIDDSPNTELISGKKELVKRIKRKINLKTKKRKRKQIDDEENDSDTPIAKIKNFSLHTMKNVSNDLKQNKLNECDNKFEIKLTEQAMVKLNKNVKKLSERKRLILTCNIVLKETTACPFRHHKSWFQCFFCTEDFMEINLLRKHNLHSHSDVEAELKKIKRYPRSLQIEISNLECRHCCSHLTDVETMALHFVEKHDKVLYKECIADYKVNSSPYTCHICKKVFHVFRTLTTHLNEHYTNCICDVCGKPFINSKRLKVHKRTHENGTYPCTTCGKVLKTKTSQSNHMESAHSKRIVKCQICFKPMKHYNDRIKHMSEVHNITHKFKCPVCDREFNIKHYLATHMRQTHGHKNKKCSVCNMAFITNHSLKKHMLKHTGERPFTCKICSKSYARSYTLKEHMRAHQHDKRLLGPQ